MAPTLKIATAASYPKRGIIMSFIAEPTSDLQRTLDLPPDVPPLTALYFYVSGSCNLACRHCWISPQFLANGKGQGRYLKFEHAQRAIEQALPLGLRSIKLTGGEPTLHPQFRDLVDLNYGHGLNTVVETNGLLVDDSLAEFLAQRNVTFISVSLDGAEAATHEYIRLVDGSFDRTVEGIKALARAGFHPQMICTLHQGNRAEVEGVIRLAEDLGCGSVKFNVVQRMGRGARFADTHGLSIQEVLDIFYYAEAELVPRANLSILFDVPVAFHPINRLLHDRSRCTILTILGILASGDVSICGIGSLIPDLLFGNLDRDLLRDIWIDHPGLRLLREQIPDQMEGICGQCAHRHFCLGRCVAQNYQMAGKLNAPYEFCRLADQQGLFPASRRIS
jgi:SynChlorMet cassette radical SAM/SPASM protein ScmF